MNDVVVPNSVEQFLAKAETNEPVGINEVVSIFLLRYEDNLHNRRLELQAQLAKAKNEQASLDKTVEELAKVGLDIFPENILGLKFMKFKDVKVVWRDSSTTHYSPDEYKNKNFVKVNVGLTDGEDKFSVIKYILVSEEHVENHNELTKLIGSISDELRDVLENIKGVGRKERQLRGKLAEMKLGQAGFSDILKNEDLVKLVQL